MPEPKRIPIIFRAAPKAPAISPKLIEFSKWHLIDKVNEKLDSGETAHSVYKWVK